ncbi:MAG: ATP-dependent Clp protease proteolytic subunit [Nitratireductor sp.]
MNIFMQDEETSKEKQGEPAQVERLFFKSRTIIVAGTINDKLAQRTVTHMMALAEESDAPINMFISSPGGHVESGDMVHDMIKFIRPVVRTIGSGWVASAGALIFVGAKKENRFCLPNTRFPAASTKRRCWRFLPGHRNRGRADHQDARAVDRLFAAATGRTPERISKDTQRDFWLNTDEAIAYGLLGKVISSSDELK